MKFLFMAPIYTWFLVTDSNGLILGWDRSLSYLKYQLPGFLMPPGIVTLNAMQTELPHPPKDVRLSNAKPHPHQLTTFLGGKGNGLPRQARPGPGLSPCCTPTPEHQAGLPFQTFCWVSVSLHGTKPWMWTGITQPFSQEPHRLVSEMSHPQHWVPTSQPAPAPKPSALLWAGL